MDALPEFFQNPSKPAKNPEIYVRYRNYIINIYRQALKIFKYEKI